MPEIIELARFTVRSGEEEAFLAKRPAMLAAARARLPGLVRIELVKLDDGEWLDIVVWKDRESAERAPQLAEGIPAFADWLSHVDQDTAMDLGVIYDRGTAGVAMDIPAAAGAL